MAFTVQQIALRMLPPSANPSRVCTGCGRTIPLPAILTEIGDHANLCSQCL